VETQIQITYRKANLDDIPAILVVRNSVLENKLSDPNSITVKDCEDFMVHRGETWVAEYADQIVGFSMVDVIDNRVWALFVSPPYEKRGIGKQLHHMMLDWFFDLGKESVWLGTSPHTRAEVFYQRLGWAFEGPYGDDEVKLRMTREVWNRSQKS